MSRPYSLDLRGCGWLPRLRVVGAAARRRRRFERERRRRAVKWVATQAAADWAARRPRQMGWRHRPARARAASGLGAAGMEPVAAQPETDAAGELQGRALRPSARSREPRTARCRAFLRAERPDASKKACCASETARPEAARRRAQLGAAPGPGRSRAGLVFVDETWARTNMAAAFHAPLPMRPKRLVAKAPRGAPPYRSPSSPPCAANRIEAPCVIEGPIDGRGLPGLGRARTARPRSARATSSCIDNLAQSTSAKRSWAARSAAAGAISSVLPPYSPDLNPIEQLFAKLKHAPRARLAASHRRGASPGAASASLPRRSSPPSGVRQLLQKLRICFSLEVFML